MPADMRSTLASRQQSPVPGASPRADEVADHDEHRSLYQTPVAVVSFGTASTRASPAWRACVALRQRNGESIGRVALADIKHFAAHLRPAPDKRRTDTATRAASPCRPELSSW